MTRGERRWKKLQHEKESLNALALHDRFVLKQILLHDKGIQWRKKFLTLDLRLHAILETKHIVCEIMKVKRIRIGGCDGTVAYTAGLCRCTLCGVNFSIPDIYCPCCGFELRRNNHTKAGSAVAIIKRLSHEM